MTMILRGLSQQVGEVGGRVEEKPSGCCFFRLKPPGFKTPWQLPPRDLDSSLEEVQKLVLKPVLYCWCRPSFSPARLAADVPSVAPSSSMVPPEQSWQNCGVS
jgi:hypothetical protein